MSDGTNVEEAGEENQLVELSFPKVREDEWAGISNPKERKKIQNRLAQRAYRQRNSRKGNLKIKFFNPSDKSHAVCPEAPARKRTFLSYPVAPVAPTVADTPPNADNSNGAPIAEADEPGVILSGSVPSGSASDEVPMATSELEMYPGALDMTGYEYRAVSSHRWEPVPDFQDCGVPNDHEFIDLIYYNVFRAFEVNTGSLGLTTKLLQLDILSPFNTVSLGGTILENLEDAMAIAPIPNPTPNLPPALQPTQLQLTILHHPYIDLFPSPKLRDNLLRVYGLFDEVELCFDIMGVCGGNPSVFGSGLIIWGDPWDISGWEVAEHFVVKWRWMFEGCDDVIQATNYWRAMRGLGNLNLSD